MVLIGADGKVQGGSGDGGFDRNTERCPECDGHWRHVEWCRWYDSDKPVTPALEALNSHIDWKKAQLEHWSAVAAKQYKAPVSPATRYDDVFTKFTAWLDRQNEADSPRDRISECLHAALSSLELAATLAGEAKLSNVKGFIIDAKDMLNPLFDFLALERMTLERMATGGTK